MRRDGLCAPQGSSSVKAILCTSQVHPRPGVARQQKPHTAVPLDKLRLVQPCCHLHTPSVNYDRVCAHRSAVAYGELVASLRRCRTSSSEALWICESASNNNGIYLEGLNKSCSAPSYTLMPAWSGHIAHRSIGLQIDLLMIITTDTSFHRGCG
eukprot:jgi/Ulvmu1/11971/UM082_0050.1